MISRALIACLLAAALSGCAAGASLFGPSSGTATGHVQIRGCGGVNRPDQTACQVQPMVGATLTFQLVDRSSSTTTTTDSAGAYRIDLKPGTYTVQATQKDSAKIDFSGQTTVTVIAGKTVTRDFTYTIQLM